MSTDAKVSDRPKAAANSAANNSNPPASKVHEGESHGFSHFAARVSSIMGSSPMFSAALALIVAWGVTGPYFHFSDTWQLVINTATTVITFLMVFLIQNTQNRDARALHLKLDEVIRALHTAHNEMIDIEKLSDRELEHLTEHYEHIRKTSEARKSRRREKHAQHAQEEPVLEGQDKQLREGQGERLQETPDEQRKAG